MKNQILVRLLSILIVTIPLVGCMPSKLTSDHIDLVKRNKAALVVYNLKINDKSRDKKLDPDSLAFTNIQNGQKSTRYVRKVNSPYPYSIRVLSPGIYTLSAVNYSDDSIFFNDGKKNTLTTGGAGIFYAKPGEVVYIGDIIMDIDGIDHKIRATDNLKLIKENLSEDLKDLASRLKTRFIQEVPKKNKKRQVIKD